MSGMNAAVEYHLTSAHYRAGRCARRVAETELRRLSGGPHPHSRCRSVHAAARRRRPAAKQAMDGSRATSAAPHGRWSEPVGPTGGWSDTRSEQAAPSRSGHARSHRGLGPHVFLCVSTTCRGRQANTVRARGSAPRSSRVQRPSPALSSMLTSSSCGSG
jgi:hypothetical protein